jgi:prepilin-type N-terminal cleavage/methylation domain-containing protein
MDKRKGFSLIETVFAIVILAIILTPIPTLLKSLGESARFISYKEAMFSATSKAMQMTLYRWDENSCEKYDPNDKNSTCKTDSKILETNSSNFGRKGDDSSKIVREFGKEYRIFMDESYSKRYSTDEVNFTEESSSYDYDDIDDWNGKTLEYNGASIQFQMGVNIFYIDDTDGNFSETNSSEVTLNIDRTPLIGKTSNIKLLEVEADGTDEFQFRFHYMSTNIGEFKYYTIELK